MRLKLLRGIGGFTGLTFIEITLKLINEARELFLLNISQGDEIVIPKELSQKQMSFSYRFYDPILKIIQDECSDSKRDFYSLKNKLTLARI